MKTRKNRILHSLAVVLVCLSMLMPSAAHAQSIPTRADGTPISDLCKSVLDVEQNLFIIFCTWYLSIPLLVGNISSAIPIPTPAPPTPTPAPIFVEYDENGDHSTITEECVSGVCTQYNYIEFEFDGRDPNARKCENPHQIVLNFDDGQQDEYLKNPYFIYLDHFATKYGYIAKIKQFTDTDTWINHVYYNLTVVCYE